MSTEVQVPDIIPSPINITIGESNDQCEFKFEDLTQDKFVHVNSLLPIHLEDEESNFLQRSGGDIVMGDDCENIS